jgi:hypothetical protein
MPGLGTIGNWQVSGADAGLKDFTSQFMLIMEQEKWKIAEYEVISP